MYSSQNKRSPEGDQRSEGDNSSLLECLAVSEISVVFHLEDENADEKSRDDYS